MERRKFSHNLKMNNNKFTNSSTEINFTKNVFCWRVSAAWRYDAIGGILRFTDTCTYDYKVDFVFYQNVNLY